MGCMAAIRRFLELRKADRARALEAFLFLGLARAAVLAVPFRILARGLGQPSRWHGHSAANEAVASATVELAELAERVSRHTPWKSNCLAKAIAVKLMLRCRGVRITMYFGMAKNDKGEFEAHAWTCSGKTILTGGPEIGRYAVVAAFADRTEGYSRE
jgi:hypothetical protein